MGEIDRDISIKEQVDWVNAALSRGQGVDANTYFQVIREVENIKIAEKVDLKYRMMVNGTLGRANPKDDQSRTTLEDSKPKNT